MRRTGANVEGSDIQVRSAKVLNIPDASGHESTVKALCILWAFWCAADHAMWDHVVFRVVQDGVVVASGQTASGRGILRLEVVIHPSGSL